MDLANEKFTRVSEVLPSCLLTKTFKSQYFHSNIKSVNVLKYYIITQRSLLSKEIIHHNLGTLSAYSDVFIFWLIYNSNLGDTFLLISTRSLSIIHCSYVVLWYDSVDTWIFGESLKLYKLISINKWCPSLLL